MQIKTGIDLLKKSRFLKSLENGGENFKNKIFSPQELRQNTPDQLASVFALKEAVTKALQLSPGSWLNISTNRKENGKVDCSFLDSKSAFKVKSLDSSISHDGPWIIAVVVMVTDE